MLCVVDAAAGAAAGGSEPATVNLLLFSCQAAAEPLLTAARAAGGESVVAACSPAASAGVGGPLLSVLPDDWVLLLHGPVAAAKAALAGALEVLQHLPAAAPEMVAAALAASRIRSSGGGAKRKRAGAEGEHVAGAAALPLTDAILWRSSSNSDTSSAGMAPHGLFCRAGGPSAAGSHARSPSVEAPGGSCPGLAQLPMPRHQLAAARHASNGDGAPGPAPRDPAARAIFGRLPVLVRAAFDGNGAVDVTGLVGVAGVELRLLVPVRRVGLIMGEQGAVRSTRGGWYAAGQVPSCRPQSVWPRQRSTSAPEHSLALAPGAH